MNYVADVLERALGSNRAEVRRLAERYVKELSAVKKSGG